MARILNANLDTNLGGENASNEVVSSQKAVKTYVDDRSLGVISDTDGDVILGSTLGGISGGGSVTVDTTLNPSSTNPVQNSAIVTALNGKLNTDASNLSAIGQKVFDGQWVNSYLALTSGSSPTTNSECDLSSYLPNDNYNYEILIEAFATTDTTSGHTAVISAFSDIITNNVYITQATAVSSAKNTTIGSAIIPIGSARKITFRGYTANVGNFGANVLGYRRIGTNS